MIELGKVVRMNRGYDSGKRVPITVVYLGDCVLRRVMMEKFEVGGERQSNFSIYADIEDVAEYCRKMGGKPKMANGDDIL